MEQGAGSETPAVRAAATGRMAVLVELRSFGNSAPGPRVKVGERADPASKRHLIRFRSMVMTEAPLRAMGGQRVCHPAFPHHLTVQ